MGWTERQRDTCLGAGRVWDLGASSTSNSQTPSGTSFRLQHLEMGVISLTNEKKNLGKKHRTNEGRILGATLLASPMQWQPLALAFLILRATFIRRPTKKP
ncbi:hypothetical protein C1H46_039755 [Malus baccata]|uniref:Uncharacterized protein n=1 Tax=Malus baccata TaxID=106549 RepID=A0A540KKH6_MALBA|nr:hypothetical protein C1H46_039755 [Malus baccata]